MATNDILNSAIELIEAGKKNDAQKLLEPYLEANPQDVTAWLWEMKTWSSIETKTRILEMCLAYNPDDQDIKLMLAALNIQKAKANSPDGPTPEPVNVPAQQHRSSLSRTIRQIIVREIDNWVKHNLLSEAQAHAIRIQYDFDFPHAAPEPVRLPDASATPKPTTPTIQPDETLSTPSPTLAQTLLSETSIKIALYLGAFFVIAAALILAALVETLRLPILFLVAGGFGIGGLALKERLPQPSFVLWIVFSVLLPINAGVLARFLNLPGTATNTYWAIVWGGMAVFWGISTWLYRSRLFSLSAFFALGIAAGMAGAFVEETRIEVYLLLIEISGFCALAGVLLLKRWQGQDFALPLFALAHLQTLAILCISLLLSLFYLITGPNRHGILPESDMGWFATASLWSLAAIFFIISDTIIPFAGFPFFAVGSLLLLPWFVLVPFHPEANVYAVGWWGWGAIFALLGEAFNMIRNHRISQYSLPFSLGALALLMLGAAIGWSSDITLGFVLFLVGALLLAVLHIARPNWVVWSIALLFASLAYLLFFHLPEIQIQTSLDTVVYQLAGAALLLSLPDLFLKADLNANQEWRWPMRVYGGLFLVLSTFIGLLVTITNLPLLVALMFGLFALFFLAFAIRYKQPEIAYLSTMYLTLGSIAVLRFLGIGYWLWPLIGLAAFYYLAGWIVKGQLPRWGLVLEISGLGLGTLMAFSAPFEHSDLGASLPIAVVATLWAIQAFRRHNIWLGFPANGFYLIAYYIVLLALKVDQPQFFSIGAALLGLVMHYLLVRSNSNNSNTAAFMVGMGSQLFLLGVTYIQMVGSRDLSFFVALFIQSLVVIVYGIVIHSRSLTFTPIAFVVLAVTTVVFVAFSGIPTVVLVGCTGIILILLGILAMLMRESLVKVGELMGDWIA